MKTTRAVKQPDFDDAVITSTVALHNTFKTTNKCKLHQGGLPEIAFAITGCVASQPIIGWA
jgi:hypothetical protein